MNSFLALIMQDFLELWNGCKMDTLNHQKRATTVTVRTALISVVCDIPALSKVAGFSSHNSLKGCSKSLRQFPTEAFGQKPNYTGFDSTNWPKLNNEMHRILAYKISLGQRPVL